VDLVLRRVVEREAKREEVTAVVNVAAGCCWKADAFVM